METYFNLRKDSLRLRENVLARTMAKCPVHSRTEFVFLNKDGKTRKVCAKCESEKIESFDD